MTNEDVGGANKVLILEDDRALQLLLEGTVQSEGYETLCADNRLSALALLKETDSPLLILADLGLPPDTNSTAEGMAFITEAMQSPRLKKIIVLTGQDQASASLQAVQAGAFDFLSKPSDSSTICAALARAKLFLEQEIKLAQEGITKIEFNARISDGLKAARDEAEGKLVKQVLEETDFNVYQTAQKLGIKRESVYYFLKKLGISRDGS